MAGFKQFRKFASDRGVCVADVVQGDKIANFAENMEEDGFLENISDIMPSYDKVDVIVCYCSPQLMNLLFYLIKGGGHLAKRFVVIGGYTYYLFFFLNMIVSEIGWHGRGRDLDKIGCR